MADKLKSIPADLLVYTIVDSIRKAEPNLDHIKENALGIATYRMVANKVDISKYITELGIDKATADILAEYMLRALSLYGAYYIMGHTHQIVSLLKQQIAYSVGLEIFKQVRPVMGAGTPIVAAAVPVARRN